MAFMKEKQYTCIYCGYKFKAYAKASKHDNPQSNSIKCPACFNFLKTWTDKTERELARLNKNE